MKAFVSIVPGIYDAIQASDEVRDALVFSAWRHVAGEQVSERTSPVAVEGRKLIVAVADKTWKRNLESLASQLLFKLNGALGRSLVDFLEFRIAPEAIDTPSRSITKDEAVTPPVELSVSARRIRDVQLRETVLSAAANCLSRKS